MNRMTSACAVAAILLLSMTSGVAAQDQPRIQESIEVSRIIIDAHLQTEDGKLPPDLTAEDFEVRVDGRHAAIESVEWISDVPVEQVLVDEEGREIRREMTDPPGRLFVLFAQTDFARENVRVLGEMVVVDQIGNFIALLKPKDKVALLSFDSHLKLRLDFTTDREQLARIFPTILRIDEPAVVAPGDEPSLAAMLDRQQLARVGTSEKALVLLARALARIPGPKTLMLIGWGLGQPLKVRAVTPEIARCAAELAAARVTVYAWNFGAGGQLGLGMSDVARNTGGFYMGASAKSPGGTLAFREKFVAQMSDELQGHFEMEVRNPVPSEPGKVHSIEVISKRRGVAVRAKNSFVDRS